MPVLQLDDQQFPLFPRPTRVGAGADADLTLPSDAALGVQAVIEPAAGNAHVIRRAVPSALVRVNGVVLGAEPTPLMHGDKVEIGGLELRYADDAKGGATQFVSAVELLALAGARRSGAAQATAASGGRLISLVDGKEYLVPGSGVVIGRDASCDVVVGQGEVSRRHAEIAPGDGGYMIRDLSANGVFVNGDRVQGSHRLMRADVLRVGREEFRFYADALPAAASPTAPVPTPESAPGTSPALDDAARSLDGPTAPSPRQPQTEPGRATATASADDTRPVLAVLETLNEGPTKGAHQSLRSVLAHVGRGAHNDVRLADESVSETHAKLQWRDDGWFLVDMGSTNGSYVGGTRVVGERRLDGTPDLRFGGVKMRFLPAETRSAGVGAKGTRAIASVDRQRAIPAAPADSPQAASRSGAPARGWILVAVVLAAAAFFVLKGRA
jgi:pSer/pThr/pTyr-binding forkhead associated (FHA) protein